MQNTNFTASVKELADINIGDCTGGCNEIKAAANAWLESNNADTTDRLYVAAKTALSKDEACGCHYRDDLLHGVVNAMS